MDWGSIRKTWWLFFGAARWLRLLLSAGGAADGLRDRGSPRASGGCGCDSAACFASAVPKQQQPRPFGVSRAPPWRACVAFTSLRGRGGLVARAGFLLVSYRPLAHPGLPSVFWDLRDTEAKCTAQ